MFNRIGKFIFFGSIFISLCAVALCVETNLLLHLRLSPLNFYLFIFGATLVQYNLHYLVKKTAVKNSARLLWTLNNKPAHKILIVTGFAFILISIFSFHFHHFIILLLFGAISVMYSFPFLPFKKQKRIKDFGLLKIITLALLWTLVTVWFPLDNGDSEGFNFQLIFLRRFIFIFVLCLLFDIRDTEVDRDENILTLAVILGKARSYLLTYLLLIIFVIISVMQFIYFYDRPQLIAMLTSAIATAMVITISKKNNSDFIYLAGVDGMMLLQALLVIFAMSIF